MPTSTEPGWYDDPDDSKAQRYWDGEGWTPRRQLKPPSGPPAQPVPPPAPPRRPPSPHQQARWPLPGGGWPQKSRTRIAIAAVIGVVAVSGVVGMCGYANTSSPTNTGNTESYKAGYEFAYEHYRSESQTIFFAGNHGYCENNAASEAGMRGLNAQEWAKGCYDCLDKTR
jgi:Protein of unknown function (DUF2510)